MQVGEMVDSTEYIGDFSVLKHRLEEDGFLLLRGVLDKSTIERLQLVFIEEIMKANWIKDGTNPRDRIVADGVACVEPQPEFRCVYDQLFAREEFHSLAHQSALVALFKGLLDCDPLIHPRKIGRIIFPRGSSRDDFTTPAHQDWMAIQGAEDTLTCWVPLHDVDIKSGGLMLAKKSHQIGLRDYSLALGAGAYEVANCNALDWRGTTFRSGDLLVFGSMMVHAGTPNTGNRLRLSMDFRYQRPSEPICRECLQLNGAPYDWEQLYSSWSDEAPQFYWQEFDLQLVDFDSRYYVERDKLALSEGAKGNRAAISALQRIESFSTDAEVRAQAGAILKRIAL